MILAPNHASFMDHFFTRRVHPPPGPVHGQVAAVRSRGFRRTSSATAECSRCGAGRPTRRRSRPRSQCSQRGGALGMYCEGGRSRTGALGRACPTGNRPAGAGVGGAGRAGGDPRLKPGSQLEAPAVPQGDRPLRHAVAVRGGARTERERQQQAADVILDRIRALHARAGGRRQPRGAAGRPASRAGRLRHPRAQAEGVGHARAGNAGGHPSLRSDSTVSRSGSLKISW